MSLKSVVGSVVRSIESNHETICNTTSVITKISSAAWFITKFALPVLGFDNVAGFSLRAVRWSALGIALASVLFGEFANGVVNQMAERRLGSFLSSFYNSNA